MMKTSAVIVSLFSLASVASAQAGPWGQCGGQGWTGPTTCVSGWVCTYSNPWYSQCLQGTSSSTTTTTATTTTTTTKTTTTSTRSTTTTTITIPSSTAFARTDGLKFNIDGKTGYYAGSNAYWLAFLANSSDVDNVLSDFYNSGLRILRIWGFNDVNTIPQDNTVWFQALSGGTATINYGTEGLQKLDYVVDSAERHGVKLIINFVNNWNDYGGMNAYVNAFGGTITGWYTNSAIQSAYRAYISALVSRYKNSNAVFAWELANEPRCHGCDTSVITNWIASTSAYIKSLDSNHMVCIGDEGFGLQTDSDGSYPYTYQEGTDFEANIAIDTIDFATFHLYPDSWSEPLTWGPSWIQSHGAVCAAHGKPCLFEEYGVTSNHCSVESPWQTAALQTNGIAGDLFWQYGDTISTSAYSVGQSPNDGNTIYFGTSDYTCLVTNHVQAING